LPLSHTHQACLIIAMMSASQNDMIAAEFLRIAAELDDEGANPYRIRAYRRAAGIIARLMEDAGALALRGELTKISGIGEDLAGKVAAFILIEVTGDHTKSVFKTIQRMAGVKAAYMVSGSYDLLVQVEADSLEALSDLLLSKIRSVDGVTKTTTCMVLNV